VVVVVSNKFLILIHPKPILLGRLPFCPCSTPIPSEFAHDGDDDVAIARRKNKKKNKKKKKILVSVSQTTTCFFSSGLLPFV
jgi:hypothetical protein